ncbi:hypothetical protein [Xanthomonas sp. D-109]|uniref:hypothetical protein n=1 Tax=Xanthomonas sp. D-109 TaxID=2821274 RepID=UPI001ADA1EF3|nr:hypothetical protein [Xanthomonas sp. D-109]MBO9880651.1 hypothetical protein [Xanthomonas sp. D-109]
MGEFTNFVRDGKISDPLKRKFSLEKWQRDFNQLNQPDSFDHEIYASGIALHKKFEAIRGALKISPAKHISATTKVRAFLAVVNRNFFVTHEKTEKAIDKFKSDREGELDEVYSLEEMSSLKLELPGGFNWMPQEVMESLVDGIELGIKVVLQNNPSLAGNPQCKDVDWIEANRELNLGVMYQFAKDVWNDCLWNGYKMIDRGSFKVFLPGDLDAIRAYRVGLARKLSLTIGFSIMAGQFQRLALARGGRLWVREVCAIKREGKKQYISIAKAGVEPGDFIQGLAIQRALAVEPYYRDLIEEKLESINGLTLSSLLNAWMVISSASNFLLQSAREKYTRKISSDSPSDWISDYVPTLQIDAILAALESAAGINKTNGKKIVDFFTFHGKSDQEIWAQPLVPVGPQTVAPVFAAIASPNLRRLIDIWMRQAGIDLAKRGPAFEDYIRQVVAERIRHSDRLVAVAKSIERDYTFKTISGSTEQLDLIFCIGKTLFIAEAKCILEPTTSKGVALHRKTVLGAAEQVIRKAKFIESNRAEFCADIRRFGISLSEDFKVVPLLVLSTSTHVGISALSVPVVDEHILCRYLDGEIEDIQHRVDDPASSRILKNIFYADSAEAEIRAPKYFESPPQMQRFVEGLRGRTVPMYAVNDADWPAYVMMMECIAGGTPLALREQASAIEDLSPATPLSRLSDG